MQPEFSRPLPLARIGAAGREELLVATAGECAALALRLRILDVAALSARLRLVPQPGGAVLAEGELRAEVTQACVVSLEPVAESIVCPLAFRLLPAGQEPADGPEDLDEIACPDGIADLGEAVAEQLALALEPYPRAPGAVLPPEAQDASADPFAALAALRRPN